MLTFKRLDDLPEAVVRLFAEVEQTIIEDMARRIASMGFASGSTQWQLSRMEAISAQQEFIVREMSKALSITEQELIDLFDEAATRAFNADDEIYEVAGYKQIPLAENEYLQRIIRSGLRRTNGEFYNLTRTTIQNATQQFIRVLDRAYLEVVTGAFDYDTAIKRAVRSLSHKGIESVAYPSGRKDYLDVAIRRAALSGINHTVGDMQLENMRLLGVDLIEVTAHHGARPTHAEWQGRIYSYSGTHEKYPDFRSSTGYGTGEGLCGWNCRHSFFPFFEGLSKAAHSKLRLDGFMNERVWFNGKELTVYEASQQQRYLERQIRYWKRESGGLSAAGIDDIFAQRKVREWQSRLRDFVAQTGLERQYGRERAA